MAGNWGEVPIQVNEHIKDWRQPYWPLIVNEWYIQAMVKYEEETNKPI